MNRVSHVLIRISVFSMCMLLLVGCPPGPENPGEGEGEPVEGEYIEGEVGPGYSEGYEEGFSDDVKYWEGYADSYETDPPDGPILYSGSEIPYLEDETYEAGYYDGLWNAYNDGYSVSYDYGFTIGFSEGYDIGFSEFWYDFLISDSHPEYEDGSFMDGYQDGFSEGSVFGAWDYKEGLAFDWEDAMWDYRSGTDLYIDEVGFGTGEYGNVYLYEYGVDPGAGKKDAECKPLRTGSGKVRQSRKADAGKRSVSPRCPVEKILKQGEETQGDLSYRPLTETVRAQLNIRPEYSPRFSGRSIALTDTWLARIERYLAERR